MENSASQLNGSVPSDYSNGVTSNNFVAVHNVGSLNPIAPDACWNDVRIFVTWCYIILSKIWISFLKAFCQFMFLCNAFLHCTCFWILFVSSINGTFMMIEFVDVLSHIHKFSSIVKGNLICLFYKILCETDY